jgi:hypothetical protein
MPVHHAFSPISLTYSILFRPLKQSVYACGCRRAATWTGSDARLSCLTAQKCGGFESNGPGSEMLFQVGCHSSIQHDHDHDHARTHALHDLTNMTTPPVLHASTPSIPPPRPRCRTRTHMHQVGSTIRTRCRRTHPEPPPSFTNLKICMLLLTLLKACGNVKGLHFGISAATDGDRASVASANQCAWVYNSHASLVVYIDGIVSTTTTATTTTATTNTYVDANSKAISDLTNGQMVQAKAQVRYCPTSALLPLLTRNGWTHQNVSR